jgi:hypothetical protein
MKFEPRAFSLFLDVCIIASALILRKEARN